MGDFPHKAFDDYVTQTPEQANWSDNPDDDYTCDECGGVGGDHDDDCSEDE